MLNRGRENQSVPSLLTGLAAIPTSITAVSALPIKVHSVILSNPTAGAIDVTFRKGGVGDTIVAVVAVASKSVVSFPPSHNGDGMMFPTGISWMASGAGAFGEIIAST